MKIYFMVIIAMVWVLVSTGCKPPVSSPSRDSGSDEQADLSSGISFSIPSLTSDGDVNSTDYAGKVMLLDFWATWCPPCRSEIPDLNNLYEAMKDQNMVIIGMTLDKGSNEQVAKAVAAFDLKYPAGAALDYVEQAPAFQGIRAIPTKYLVKDGVIVGGPYQGVVPIEKLKADIAAHL